MPELRSPNMRTRDEPTSRIPSTSEVKEDLIAAGQIDPATVGLSHRVKGRSGKT
jgi:hypothetical protein